MGVEIRLHHLSGMSLVNTVFGVANLLIHGEVIDVDPNDSLHIDTAVAIAHSKIEKFRSDWHSGHIANTECYPLSIESENTGIFFEQMFDAITSN